MTSTIPQGYERGLVPALMRPCADALLARVPVPPGARVLDAAAGTGIVTRQLGLARSSARVVALDAWDEMAAFGASVARVPYVVGSLDAIPFRDASFDVALCQHGLPFADDPRRAVAELKRVTRPGGRVGVLVWTALAQSRGFAAIDAAARRHLDAPLTLRFEDALETEAGLRGLLGHVERVRIEAPFRSGRAFAEAYVAGSFLAEVEADEKAWRAFHDEVDAALAGVRWHVEAHVAWTEL